jgi:serine/threonine protein kinase
MICCLNPDCPQPLNSDGVTLCATCGTALIIVLRHRYRIMKPIGRGGFGATYLAEDGDRRNASCVVKQFSPSAFVRNNPAAMEKATELFNQEAERLLQLEGHPQIPRLFAYFEDQGKLYLVQEFIQGQTLLAELRKNGVYGDRQIEALLRDLLPVLQFIHDHQVIHRDIKPENIIRRQQDGKPVLIDFGVARLVTGTILTGGATTTGTPGYAPPEQMQQGKVYPASDLYSLGATCLHLLTGIYPHDLYDSYMGQWVWRDRLSEANHSVGDRLGQVLDRLIQPLVKDRYISAADALQGLDSTVPPTVMNVPPTRPGDPFQTQPPPELEHPTEYQSGTVMDHAQVTGSRAPQAKQSSTAVKFIAAIAAGSLLTLIVGGGILWVAIRTTPQPSPDVATGSPSQATTDSPSKEEAIAQVQAIIGTRTDGWSPLVLKGIPLQDNLLPTEVDQLMPGGGNISDYGFSEILVSDIPGLWKYRFSYPEDSDGQRRLYSLSLFFDPALRGHFSFEEFAELLATKYGELEPGEVDDGIVIWSGPDSASATLTDGINDFDPFELNITFP